MISTEPALLGPEGDLLKDRINEAAKDEEGFLTYLQKSWLKDGEMVLKSPKHLEFMKNIEVVCEKGVRWSLQETHLPLQDLQYLRSRYLLPTETFQFINTGKSAISGESASSWMFLAHLGVGMRDDLRFHLNLLRAVRCGNVLGAPKYPRRVLELYLRIDRCYNMASDKAQACELIQKTFEAHSLVLAGKVWRPPVDCILDNKNGLSMLNTLRPTPESWGASQQEESQLEGFYKSCLQIHETCDWIKLTKMLKNLSYKWYGPDAGQSKLYEACQIYRFLDKMIPDISDELPLLINRFKTSRLILITDLVGVSPVSYNTDDCVWAPFTHIHDKNDLSKEYPDLKKFFTQVLGVKRYEVGEVYNQLLYISTMTPVDAIKELFFKLNLLIPTQGHLIDRKHLLDRKVFPVRGPSNEVDLTSTGANWFIDNHPRLSQSFVGKVPLLIFSPQEVWLLKPLLVWADVEERYLSRHIEEILPMNSLFSIRLPDNIVAARAVGLVRVATHFRSPRANNADARKFLEEMLRQSDMFPTNTDSSYTKLATPGKVYQAPSTYPGVSCSSFLSKLSIRVPLDPELQTVAMLVSLPQCFANWLMTCPKTGLLERVDEATVNVIRSVLHAPVGLVDLVLKAEGIVPLEGLDELEACVKHNRTSLEERGSALVRVTPASKLIAAPTSRTRPFEFNIPEKLNASPGSAVAIFKGVRDLSLTE